MKRRIFSLIAILMIVITTLFGCAGNGGTEILKVMNWGDYIDESLIPEFEKYYKEQTGRDIHVIYQTVDNPQIMATKIETGKEDWDLACPSESIAEKMLKNGSLLPIDTSKMPNYQEYVSPFMKQAFAEMEAGAKTAENMANTYSIGYMWGTFGIMYNTEILKETKKLKDSEELSEVLKNEGWGLMWDTDFKGLMLMKNAARETLPIALTYVYREQLLNTLNNQGYDAYKQLLDEIYNLDINTSKKLIEAEEALTSQKRDVDTLYETDDGKDGMVNGIYALDQAWSGDAVWAMLDADDAGVSLDFFIPEEGSNIWYDAWVIPKYAKNKKAAQMWIDFLCIPDNATTNMDFIGYTSTTKSPDVIEWSFKNELMDTALALEENSALSELYDSLEDVSDEEYDAVYTDFTNQYDEWYTSWYNANYANWYSEASSGELEALYGKGIDLRYFYNDEGVTEKQLVTSSSGKTYYTDKILANSIQYPPESDIAKCAVMKGFANNMTEINNMWVRVKGQILPGYVSTVMLLAAAAAAAILIYYIIRKRKERAKLSKLLVRRHLHSHNAKTA